MKDAVLSESQSLAQKNMMAYLQNLDVQYIADDAVYKNLSMGEEYRGRAEIGAMLHYMYKVAFDAKPDVKSYIITEDRATFDGFFKGRHIGEFRGIAPTQKEVNVPLSVVYDLENGLIKEARIYMLGNVLMQQLGVVATGSREKVAYLTRDIFHLKFGHFKEVKALLEEAMKSELMPNAKMQRVFTDFTGDAYRLILEEGFDSLADYENAMVTGMRKDEWQQWYEKFKPHVERGYREILKQVY